MRLKLKLSCSPSPPIIPINYNYQFSSAIYLLLKFGSPEFSKFLHDKGYTLDTKNFKLFTFAVRFKKYEMVPDEKGVIKYFKLLSPNIELIVSSPMEEDFIKNFVIGTFEKQNIYINHDSYSTKFILKYVEILPEPKFTDEMSFRLLSPMVLSTGLKKNGKLFSYYYRYFDEDLVKVLKQNLIRKYIVLHRKEPQVDDFYFEFNKEEIKKKNGKVSKLITINEGLTNSIKVKGIQCGFKIRTNSELIKVGYECGFGEKNSMGFGMVEIDDHLN